MVRQKEEVPSFIALREIIVDSVGAVERLMNIADEVDNKSQCKGLRFELVVKSFVHDSFHIGFILRMLRLGQPLDELWKNIGEIMFT